MPPPPHFFSASSPLLSWRPFAAPSIVSRPLLFVLRALLVAAVSRSDALCRCSLRFQRPFIALNMMRCGSYPLLRPSSLFPTFSSVTHLAPLPRICVRAKVFALSAFAYARKCGRLPNSDSLSFSLALSQSPCRPQPPCELRWHGRTAVCIQRLKNRLDPVSFSLRKQCAGINQY